MKLRIVLSLILLAAVTRLALQFLPHPPHNFSPLAATGLFGAAWLSRRWMAVLVPVIALFISDLFINNIVYSQYYEGFVWYTSLWIYAAFLAVIALGLLFFREKVTPVRVVTASVSGSVAFFLITNFSVWVSGGMYPPTGAGLLACYVAGLPFFSNTLLGDLFFSGVLFGTYAWLTKQQFSYDKI